MNIMVTTAVIMLRITRISLILKLCFKQRTPTPASSPPAYPPHPHPFEKLGRSISQCICSRPTRLTRQVMDHSASGAGPKTADRANVTKTAELTPKTWCTAVIGRTRHHPLRKTRQEGFRLKPLPSLTPVASAGGPTGARWQRL